MITFTCFSDEKSKIRELESQRKERKEGTAGGEAGGERAAAKSQHQQENQPGPSAASPFAHAHAGVDLPCRH